MKFGIIRTSQWDNENEAPCKGCIKGERVERIHHRDYPQDHDTYEMPIYYEYEGIPMVERTIRKTTWFRDFNSIGDLLAFQKEVDCSIILLKDERTIEIYDDYRE